MRDSRGGPVFLLAEGRRTSPTFFGYVFSPATAVGVAGDLLASAADQNVTSWRSAPAATHIERVVVRWLGQFVGFSAEADGILVSVVAQRHPELEGAEATGSGSASPSAGR